MSSIILTQIGCVAFWQCSGLQVALRGFPSISGGQCVTVKGHHNFIQEVCEGTEASYLILTHIMDTPTECLTRLGEGGKA